MLKIGVVGASGYSGIELVRLVLNHPKLELSVATAYQYAGKKLHEIYPQFMGRDITLVENDLNQLTEQCQLVFLCVPHTQAMAFAKPLYEAGIPLIDLSADFRFQDSRQYSEFYNTEHTCPELLEEAVYGLPELHRDKIKTAKLIANPGCYATGALLGLVPLFRSGMEITRIIVDAKSGISGAGRKAEPALLLAEAIESVRAYQVASHRHQPEIFSQLNKIGSHEFRLTFTPHLIPMKRGILSTIYVQLEEEDLERDFREIYADYYANEPFVTLLPPDVLPQTKAVSGTNNCHINLVLDKAARELIIITAIDNLLKGASGQAVQNLNIRQGFTETTGLTDLPPPV